MSSNRVVVKYYDSRLLLTCDINAILAAIFELCGRQVDVEFVGMSESERRDVAEEVQGIPLIQERFRVFDMEQPNTIHRRLDVEELAVGRRGTGNVQNVKSPESLGARKGDIPKSP